MYIAGMAKTTLSDELTIQLVAPTHEVNAMAVASSMSAIVSLLNEIQKQVSENNPISIKVRPFEKGSFEIYLELTALAGTVLLTEAPAIEQAINYLRNILLHIRDSRKALRNGVQLSHFRNDGTIIIADEVKLIIPSKDSVQELTRASRELQADESIEGLKLLKGKGKKKEAIVDIPREDFEFLAEPDEDTQGEERRDVTSNATLTIASPDLLGDGKWRFRRKGATIWATIADEVFRSKVYSGRESFKAGDTLKVKLVTHQQFNEVTREYDDKGYTIKQVIHHEKAKRQKRLDDLEES
jgi:hypothetical protein